MEIYKILIMTNDVLVSVVIPTYNAENYIQGCLEAAIHQTYSGIEIIIVDDGSSDGTRQICAEFAENDKRIKIYPITNSGASIARNVGIDNARGKYIVFFDADDRPEKSLIQSYLDALSEWRDKKVSFLTCGMYFDNILYKNVEDKTMILEADHGFIEGENYLLSRSYASTLAWLKIFNFVTNKLYDLRKINELGIRFDPNVNIGEDLKFNLDYLDGCPGNIGMVNKPLYHYINRSYDSLSLTYHKNDIEDTKVIYRRFLDWESRQEGVTKDNLLVIKSIYISDWISRLTTMHDALEKRQSLADNRSRLDNEIRSNEFKSLLKQVHRSGKISHLRYFALMTGRFDVFCFLRKLYQFSKG